MKKVCLLIITFILFLSVPSFSEEKKEAYLLFTGEWHDENVNVSSGEGWFGFCETANGFELAETSILVEVVYDPLRDKGDTHTGKKVTAKGVKDPLFLIKGMNMKSGPVKTVFNGRAENDLSLSIKSDEPYQIDLYYENVKDDSENFYFKNYRLELYLKEKNKRQTLIKYEMFPPNYLPRLLWAGDLDRDGKLDFLFDLSCEYYRRAYTLFLSSCAKDGEMVGKAAEFLYIID